MKIKKNILLFLLFLFIVDLLSAQCIKKYPVADGTFIQNDLIAHWDDARWRKELNTLKSVGMHYIVIAPTLWVDKEGRATTIYSSSLPNVKNRYANDLVENCLRNAQKVGFKVFIGLNMDEKWWSANFTFDWFMTQMKTGNALAADLIAKYKSRYKNTMYGWYWVWEVDNIHCTTPLLQNELSTALNVNIDYLHSVTPDMPFMLCPFFNYRLGTSNQNKDMWTTVFKNTHFSNWDVFAPQDCIGAGGLVMPVLNEWFRDLKAAVDTKPGLLFWSDVETFDQRFWSTASLFRFVSQMKIVQPYVSNYITFAYSHYYGPDKVDPQYHRAYRYYTKQGTFPRYSINASVVDLQYRRDMDGYLSLSWKVQGKKKNIAGFYIYQNDSLVGNWQYSRRSKDCQFKSKEILSFGKYIYSVQPYNVMGDTTKRIYINLNIY